jgi:NAD(P)-dependent dehydrogenase (short-subunit alcohol dehydrogenase family)
MNRPDRSLSGRSALITGASQGLGFAIACAYVKAGASVLLCARDAAMLERARAEVAALASPDQVVLAKQADVSRREDVEELAKMALSTLPALQILVNNAGVYGPIGPVEDVDWDGWLHAIEINLFGSIFLCRALVPHLKARHYGKIVQLSGGGATNPLPRFSAYAASKAAVVRFAETLAEELRGDHIDVNCIAPGALNTRLLDEVLTAGPIRAGRTFHERSVKQKQEGGAPLDKGADLAVYLGSAASDGITGKLLSAVWDPWETLAEHHRELGTSDVYTLRRIVPDDRGFKWGNR